MKGKFYVIGVGPGDPELLTLKAMRILNECPVWVVPKGSLKGESTALNIIGDTVSRQDKEVLEQYFPMKKIHRGKKADPEVAKAWQQTALAICERLKKGQDVVFPTLGDPAIYSTGFYVCEALLEIMEDREVGIIPGVSSIGATAAAVGQPLCLGDERLVVIPATFENGKLKETLEQFDTVVLMKVHRVMDRLVPLLAELNLLDKAVLVERTSQNEERIQRDLVAAAAGEQHYFSTIIVRKK
ncbi:MAG: precorrin-2 C(20)-methyltransferase [Thermodesulfobacteriota bacterium]